MSKKLTIDRGNVVFYFVRVKDMLYSHFHHEGYDYIIQAKTSQDMDRRRDSILRGKAKPLLKLSNPERIKDSVNVLGYLPDAVKYISVFMDHQIKDIEKTITSDKAEEYILVSHYINESKARYIKDKYRSDRKSRRRDKETGEEPGYPAENESDIEDAKTLFARLFTKSQTNARINNEKSKVHAN